MVTGILSQSSHLYHASCICLHDRTDYLVPMRTSDRVVSRSRFVSMPQEYYIKVDPIQLRRHQAFNEIGNQRTT